MDEGSNVVRGSFGGGDEPRPFDWRKAPRSEMFERVITAVDCGYGEAQETGDTDYVAYLDAVVYPFLEAEVERARAAERG